MSTNDDRAGYFGDGERPTMRGSVVGGAYLIHQERLRQQQVEGRTSEHDDEHVDAELLDAAIAYAMHEAVDPPEGHDVYVWWPWERASWKPADPLRNLVKAGALIAAEIDRRQRNGD